MKHIFLLLFFIQLLTMIYMQKKTKMPEVVKEVPNSPSRDNPTFVRDRLRNIIFKPQMPPTWQNQFRQPYDPAWMDYCDPYHCNDYHRNVCGLNRRKMKFKYFQSICHLLLNNQCANFRGSMKFDMIDLKFCRAYVMFLRAGCPRLQDCDNVLKPVCAMSSIDGHSVLFKNKCYMDVANCRNSTFQEYEKVYMSTCEYSMLSEDPKYSKTLSVKVE